MMFTVNPDLLLHFLRSMVLMQLVFTNRLKNLSKTDMSPVGDITIYESQLFRAYGAPTAADRIRNPCYHATVWFRIQRFNQLNK